MNQIRYLFNTKGNIRREEETLLAMKESIVTKKYIDGVKGISPLINIPGFLASTCTPIDFMHNVCLGVVKYLADIWFDAKNNKMEYYLGLKVRQIDDRLSALNAYSEISRYPRNISERNQWKANEWLNFLLYYSNPSLIQILPITYYNNFQKLRKAIRILLSSNLVNEDLVKCESIMQKFVKQYQDLYGEKYMVYNVHLLLHLVESVRNFGPLWGFSLFPYENLNGFLKGFVKGPKEPLIQMNIKYLIHHNLNFKKYSDSCRPEVTQFCEKMIMSGISNISTTSCKFISSFILFIYEIRLT